jgi:hypothetical protein
MRERQLRSGENWQTALKQKGLKQTGMGYVYFNYYNVVLLSVTSHCDEDT